MACFFRLIGAIRVRMHLKACLLHPSWNRQTNQRLVKPNPRTEAAFLAQVKQTQPNRREHGGGKLHLASHPGERKEKKRQEKKKKSSRSEEISKKPKNPSRIIRGTAAAITNESYGDR